MVMRGQQKQVIRFGVAGATGQLLPGVGPGPLAPGAEHPQVAIKVGAFAGLLLAMVLCVAYTLLGATGWIGRVDGDGHEGAAAAGCRLGVGGATGQLLPGVGLGPLAPGAEHPEVASKVRPV
jgi:hypothetical protein